MSPLEAIDAVLASNLTGAAKAVALVVARRDGDRGCFVSMERLAREAGVSERGARKALRELEGLGVVVTEHVPGKGSVRRLVAHHCHVPIRPTPEHSAPRNHVPPEPSSPHPGTQCRTPRNPVPPKRH